MNWRHWSYQIIHPSSVDECRLWAARRVFETMDTSHRLRRALLAGVRASAHTQGIVNGDVVCVWRKVKRNKTGARSPSAVRSCHRSRKKRKNVFVSYRRRVT